MTSSIFPPIFDGHNDVLLKQHNRGPAALEGFKNGYEEHIDLPKSKIGGFAGGFFAVYVPSISDDSFSDEEMCKPRYDLPLPAEIPQKDAIDVVLSQTAILHRLQNDGSLQICTTVSEIRECMASGKMAAILHIEGAEGIDTGFDTLEVLFQAGLRSLGPVWSRPTAFGHGVPFRYPSDGDTGEGLTDAGKDLVRECNRLGIMLDMSHMNSKGFWDTVQISDAPIVATHSNAHALSPHARNLTDDQLAAIKDSDGMVGLNFAVAFLRQDGQMNPDTSLDIMIRHLDYLIDKLGEDRVGFGSDFDGATVPNAIGDAAGLPVLCQAMKDAGYGDALMKKICHENWLAVLERTWKA